MIEGDDAQWELVLALIQRAANAPEHGGWLQVRGEEVRMAREMVAQLPGDADYGRDL